ncbi:unnamed protein product [Parnassius mnemosyne]|uniref:Uncharacterized protein n=1 Tax=Parnassius mnemosyne TaxID=213953 RepID=A0AAV1KIQ8_9NEOP
MNTANGIQKGFANSFVKSSKSLISPLLTRERGFGGVLVTFGVRRHAAAGRAAGRAAGGSPGDDSDYFTPEEPATTLLTSPRPSKPEAGGMTVECAPQRWALPHHVTSLPGTPLSQWSARSSGESYSSTSSSRQLLAAALPPAAPV